MRPSTIFILTIAILLGVGAAFAAKMYGFLGQKPEEVVVKKPEVLVLVAAKNLFAGDVIDGTGVRTRAIKPEEVADFEKNKDQYLPAVNQAAALRVPNQNIEADKPILRSYLKELAKPEPLNERLLPEMRAVNVSVLKDQAAGGLIQVGEWVDVILTSTVDGPDSTSDTRTATIVSKVRVIAKRNVLWSVMAPLPADKPVEFTLEASPYRAALIEFGKKKGQLSLVPLPKAEQEKLEQKRNQALTTGTRDVLASFDDANTQAYKDEQNRVDGFAKGDVAVGDADLIRIFGLKYPEKPIPPPPPPPPVVPEPPVTTSIEQLVGTKRENPVIFGPKGEVFSGQTHSSSPKTGSIDHSGEQRPIIDYIPPKSEGSGPSARPRPTLRLKRDGDSSSTPTFQFRVPGTRAQPKAGGK